jgi:hypothetical protein
MVVIGHSAANYIKLLSPMICPDAHSQECNCRDSDQSLRSLRPIPRMVGDRTEGAGGHNWMAGQQKPLEIEAATPTRFPRGKAMLRNFGTGNSKNCSSTLTGTRTMMALYHLLTATGRMSIYEKGDIAMIAVPHGLLKLEMIEDTG